MSKKKWTLLIIVCIISVFVYIKFFYKTFDEKSIAQNADCIIAFDVKRITNTILWNIITTPSQWKRADFFSKSSDEVSWKDMIIIPDYLFLFHVKNQPTNVWYTIIKVKNENDFLKGLERYRFKKLDNNEYISESLHLRVFKNGDKLLISNLINPDENYIDQVATEIFTEKKHIEREYLSKILDEKSHLVISIAANDYLQKDAIITGTFDKSKLKINCNFIFKKKYSFSEKSFSYDSNSLLTLGFTQPSSDLYSLLSEHAKYNISKALNMNMDSLLLNDNESYSLDLQAVKTKIDSAITYTYDDDFNKVEQKVVNEIQEPSFNFSIQGKNVADIHQYWKNNDLLEQTSAGKLFTPMPFVKAYTTIKNSNELLVTSENYIPSAAGKNINCIFFLNILADKISSETLKFIPGNVTTIISNIKSINVVAKKKDEQIIMECNFSKKENDLPFIKW